MTFNNVIAYAVHNMHANEDQSFYYITLGKHYPFIKYNGGGYGAQCAAHLSLLTRCVQHIVLRICIAGKS